MEGVKEECRMTVFASPGVMLIPIRDGCVVKKTKRSRAEVSIRKRGSVNEGEDEERRKDWVVKSRRRIAQGGGWVMRRPVCVSS